MATDAELRRALGRLSGQANGDLARLWRQVSTAAEARVALNDILPALLEEYGAAAASLAAEWYVEARAKADRPGRFSPIVARSDQLGAEPLIGWAASEATSLETMLPLVQGGLTKRLTVVAARTIGGSAIKDPQASGWQRVAHSACKGGFCNMLAGRGAVYSEASVDFAAHDNCGCTATPAWKGREVPIKPYAPTLRHVSDADRERVRNWIATNLD